MQENYKGARYRVSGIHEEYFKDGQVKIPDLVTILSPEEELLRIEGELEKRSFIIERSRLGELEMDFPAVGTKSFLSWLSHFSKSGDARVLEIGGGRYQVAASEILSQYPGISRYTALEKLPLSIEALMNLEEERDNGRYEHLRSGISKMGRLLGMGQYDVIFAHRVVPFLPNPFKFMSDAHSFLREGGVLFCDRLPAYQEVVTGIERELRQEGFEVTFRISTRRDRRLIKPGIVFSDVGIQNNGKPIIFPVCEGPQRLQDSEGNKFITREFYYSQAAAA